MQESKPLQGYKYTPGTINSYNYSKRYWSWFFTPKWKLRKLDFWGRIDNKGRYKSRFYPKIIWGNMQIKYHSRGKLNREYKVKNKEYGR